MPRCMMCVFAFLLGVMVALQGCGPTDNTTTTTTTVTTTTVTTTTTLACQGRTVPDPRDGKDVADQMNSEYNGYRKDDKTTPVGVFLRATHSTDIYCHKGCYQGGPDCRVSGSLLNWKQMIDPNTGAPGGFFGDQQVGYYVNASVVKTKLNKCTYAWDGASMNKANFGCGCPQGDAGNQSICDPSDPRFKCSAYNNKVPPKCDQQSGAGTSNVAPCACDQKKGGDLPANGNGAGCFYKGVALDPNSGTTTDETHDMLSRRIDNSGPPASPGQCDQFGSVLCWNEMILDGELMVRAMEEDPAGTISAIVYAAESAKADALAMATEMLKLYPCMKKKVPIIRLRKDVDARTGQAEVFRHDPAEEDEEFYLQ